MAYLVTQEYYKATMERTLTRIALDDNALYYHFNIELIQVHYLFIMVVAILYALDIICWCGGDFMTAIIPQ